VGEEHVDDVRVIDTDHFIIFRHPEPPSWSLRSSGARLDVPHPWVIAKECSLVSRQRTRRLAVSVVAMDLRDPDCLVQGTREWLGRPA
jgi:hypothetical protein